MDLSIYDLSTAYSEPFTSWTVATDVATAGQTVDNSGSGDVWGGWFRDAASQVLNAAILTNAVQTSTAAKVQTTPAINPAYVQQTTAKSNNNLLILLAVGAVALVVLKA
ncbi:hypothetical protein HUU62_04345 [Rhodoferax sp. 4810]|nr:hypothetical protein [Rhodoferax jenense]